MKVLFVINQLFRGGAETALVNLLSAMPPEKYQVDLMVYDQIDLPDTVSLIPKIPSYVKVHNIAENEKKIAYIKKAIFKIRNKITGRTPFRRNAYKVLRNNEYDVAISFGEWFSPSLVANYAKARWKYVWIHADADKADFFHPDVPLYHEHFDGFIFVSNNSRLAAEKQYPFLANRSYIINNMIDEGELSEKSALAPSVPLPKGNLPCLVTVANVRPEKNHLRQVRVMKKLFEKGLKFYWLNIGSQANSSVFAKITAEIKALGLEDYFLFTGATDNPYSVMKRADAVCVLSDHESWSMVITEAKALGVPVIATKTSGALEQISHLENGILCDFDDGDIAEKIAKFLENPEISAKIRTGLNGFSSEANALSQLEAVLKNEEKTLFVFDDINYISGARAAALLSAEHLKESRHVDLFSAAAPKDENAPKGFRVIDIEKNKRFKCLSLPIKEVLKSHEYSKRQKLTRIVYAFRVRLKADASLYKKLLKKELTAIFNAYDSVIVVSEASKLRHFISTLSHPKKIQWIHTDYVSWRNHSSWTKKITANDKKMYASYDSIVCLSDSILKKFVTLYPSLASKTHAIKNLIDYEKIIEKSTQKLDFELDKSKLNLITVGRMEAEKRYDRILLLAKELKERGVNFTWYLVGDGNLYESHKAACREMGLSENVVFTGYLSNACPLLSQCDLFVLLSEYEGTPVTIDEAKVLGVPVLARDVGGIRDQITDKTGKVLSEISASDIVDFRFDLCLKTSESEFKEYNSKVTDKLKSIL